MDYWKKHFHDTAPAMKMGSKRWKKKILKNSRYFQIKAIQMVDISKTLSSNYKEALQPIFQTYHSK